ncbi:MAG: DMT family transporter [Sphingomicrobium sp.]
MTADTTSHSLRGAMLCIVALFLFACMDTTTKYLAASYNVPLIVALRYIGNLLLMILLLGPTRPRELLRTDRTALVLVRAACLAVTSLLVGLALQLMPVAETTAINFIAPLVVVLLARPVLGERIGRWGWSAALLGFAGVMLIVRPGSGLNPTGVALALGAVGAGAAYQLLSRVLVDTERTIAMLFYTALLGSVLFGIALPWTMHGHAPSAFELLLFLSLGIYGGLGHFLFTKAYRHADASILAPMIYFQLVWAGLLGWLIFRHAPDLPSLAGMAVIAVSGLMIAFKPKPDQRSLRSRYR